MGDLVQREHPKN